MSMETQLCDSVNVHPLWLTFSKLWDSLSSMDEDYMFNYPHLTQISYTIPNMIQGGFQISTREPQISHPWKDNG